MKATLLGMIGMFAAASGAAGCAHALTDGAQSNRYGELRVDSETRLLLAGPAYAVHTTFDEKKPVWLYVVRAVRGDDRDCALSTVREEPIGGEAGHPVNLPAGRELCVAVAGATDVLWQAHIDSGARPATIGLATAGGSEPGSVALQ